MHPAEAFHLIAGQGLGFIMLVVFGFGAAFALWERIFGDEDQA